MTELAATAVALIVLLGYVLLLVWLAGNE